MGDCPYRCPRSLLYMGVAGGFQWPIDEEMTMKMLTDCWNVGWGNGGLAYLRAAVVLAGLAVALGLPVAGAEAGPQEGMSDEERREIMADSAEAAYETVYAELSMIMHDIYEPIYSEVPLYADAACEPSCSEYYSRLLNQFIGWIDSSDNQEYPILKEDLIFNKELEDRLLKPYDRFCQEYMTAIEERYGDTIDRWSDEISDSYLEVCGSTRLWDMIIVDRLKASKRELDFDRIRSFIGFSLSVAGVTQRIYEMRAVVTATWNQCIRDVNKCTESIGNLVKQTNFRHLVAKYWRKFISLNWVLTAIEWVANAISVIIEDGADGWIPEAIKHITDLSNSPDDGEFKLKLLRMVGEDRAIRQIIYEKALEQMMECSKQPDLPECGSPV